MDQENPSVPQTNAFAFGGEGWHDMPDHSWCCFDSHPKCYALNGFCDLFFDPVHILQNVKGLLNVYEIKDLTQLISIKQMVQTAGLCGEGVMEKFLDAIKRILEGGFLQ